MKNSLWIAIVGCLLIGQVVGFFLGSRWATASERSAADTREELAMVTAASQLKLSVLLLDVLARQDYESARVAVAGNVGSLLVILTGHKPNLSPAGQAIVDDSIKEASKYRAAVGGKD